MKSHNEESRPSSWPVLRAERENERGRTQLLALLLCSSFLITPLCADIEICHVAPPEQQQHYFLVMKGAYEQSSGDYAQAAETFAALTPFIDSPQIRVAAWQVAFDQKKYHTLTNAADEIRTLHADNEELQLKLAQSFLNTNQMGNATALLLDLRKQFPHDHRIAYFAVTALLKQHRVVEAESIISNVLQQKSLSANHYLFHFLRAKNAFLNGNYADALAHVNNCSRTHPSFSRVQVLEGLIHEKLDNKQQALDAYTRYLTQVPTDKDIQQKQVALAFECGDFLLVRNALQKEPKEDATYYHDLALVTFKLGDIAKAHTILDKAEALSPRFTKARTLRIHLLSAEKAYNKIAALFTQWLQESPHDVGLIKTIMNLEQKGLSRAQVHDILRTVADRDDAPQVCFALGDMLHEVGEYKEARERYDCVIGCEIGKQHNSAAPHGWVLPPSLPRNARTAGQDDGRPSSLSLHASQCHFQKACTYFKENNLQEMQRELAAAQEGDQESDIVYPSVYNLLAFANPQGPDALALVEKALEADATNAAYLDTKRVVLQKALSNQAAA